MKKINLSLMIVLLFMFALVSITQGFQNEPEGFRDLKWGDPPTEDMRKFFWPGNNLSDSGLYWRETDNLQIGGAELESIKYGFYLGQFRRVFIETKNDNAEPLKDVLELKFGLGEKFDNFLDDNITMYQWTGDKAMVKLVTNRRYKSAELEIYSIEIYHQYLEDLHLRSEEEARRKEEERQKAAEEGLGDF